MNRFEESLTRIKKNIFPNDDWTEDDVEHYETITDALKKQIPQKTLKRYESGNLTLDCCPRCHTVFFFEWLRVLRRLRTGFGMGG